MSPREQRVPGTPASKAASAADARAEAQARAKAVRAERAAELDAHFAEGVPGRGILRAAVVSTVVFGVVTLLAAVIDSREWRLVAAFTDVTLFAGGCVLFVVVLVMGARRSRDADMTMSGWWFLSGSAPDSVRRVLLGAIALQTAIAFAGAFARPFTALAFGILVPVWPLALSGLWGARHGWFPRLSAARR